MQLFNRRQILLAGAGAATAYTILGVGRRGKAATPKAVIHETKVISHQPQYYHGWPTLARRQSGELLLVYSGGRRGHICPFGRVELMRSHDDGKTWGWPCVVLDTEIDDRDGGVLETAKGTLLISTFTSLAYAQRQKLRAGDIPATSAHNRLTEKQRKSLLGVYVIRSTDGGLTWSPPCDSVVNNPHGPIQLADGRLIYLGMDHYRGERVGVSESLDDGQAWHWLAEMPHRPGDNPTDYPESHLVETAEGRIIAHIRNHNKNNDGETLQSESSDGGKTWSAPHSIGVWGMPSHLLKLKDGRLLMTYGYRRAPFGNQARISEDDGRSWSEAITISADGIGVDLGYPSTVQLGDGSLLTVWYELMKETPKAVLRQAHWSLA